MIITSLQNSTVKRVVKLRARKWRDRERVLLIEGIRPIQRALDADWNLEQILFCSEQFRDGKGSKLVQRCRAAGLETIEFAPAPFDKMSYRDNPEGIIAIGSQAGSSLAKLSLNRNPLILIAEGVEKPGNLGSMLRVADGAGADALLLADGVTDINNPNVVRSSIGAIFSMPIVEDSSENIQHWIEKNNILTVATTPSAPQLYTDADLSGPVAILVGAEHAGLTDFWLDAAKQKISIPMRGVVDSLNVSTSASILLYEALRQRK